MKHATRFALAMALTTFLSAGCSRQDAGGKAESVSASTHVLVLNDSTFDAQIQSGVVLVDFWATWCGPCKMQVPIVEQVAGRVEGKATIAKVDVDAAPKIAQRFKIQAIPTLVVFKNGKPQKQFVGLTEADALIAAITAAGDSK